ncbi:hypothetical protein WMY93_007940 [Mugilogobius chulae]|uniref:SHSP domain-containing protein n=1 Tax=Mugilogobius chulae TaxID=88201 RepID=A0AAW0PI30_9GOBI
MLCPRFHSPLVDPMWPLARSLWPETRPLFYNMEQEFLRNLQEMRHNMEYMEKLHQRIFDQIDQSLPSTAAFRPVGNKLRVSGKTEKKQDDGKGSYSYRCQEFRQEFDLPHGVDPESVSCSLVGGRLQITAPQNKALEGGKERLVPINVEEKPAAVGQKEETQQAEKN